MDHVLETFFSLALLVLLLTSVWRMFEKAGHPGWASVVPVYSLVVLCRVAGKPGWWWVLLLVPVLNLVILVRVAHGLARHFGFGAGMTVLVLFLPFVACPILGFGPSPHRKLSAETFDRP